MHIILLTNIIYKIQSNANLERVHYKSFEMTNGKYNSISLHTKLTELPFRGNHGD